MPPSSSIDDAVGHGLASAGRVVLAVSGGRDSMVLMHAAARVARAHVAGVITVDHGTGAAAAEACDLVESAGRALGLDVIRSRVRPAARTEDAWRRARWHVLRRAAAGRGARVATAHTRDDQAETVLMRVMRQAGARGLAGLASSGSIVRPFLEVDRAAIDAYARRHAIAFVEDPTNLDLRYLRNRIRRELLPALERASPGFERELLAIGRRAAAWRADVERTIDALVPHRSGNDELRVQRAALAGYDADALRWLWPALAARAGVVLDRRGTERLTSFTIGGRRGSRIQLSGGIEAVRHGDELILREHASRTAERSRFLDDVTRIGGWRFVIAEPAAADGDAWVAALPTDRPLRVRTWRAGDRMVPGGERRGESRRVKRLLREAGIEAGIRPGWPVVLSGDEIVWVPGVRRGTAATVRSGRPVAVYRCERIDR